jgi:major membrane immunogen (membrane-anchored lipoprotein)
MKQVIYLIGIVLLASCGRGADFQKDLEKTQQCIENSSAVIADSCQQQFFSEYKMPLKFQNIKNGTYTGTSIPDNEGYVHKASLTFKDGMMVKATYDEWKDGVARSTDSTACIQADSLQKAVYYSDIFRFYEQELLVRKSIMDIDCISGTTKILYRVRMAACLALDEAN